MECWNCFPLVKDSRFSIFLLFLWNRPMAANANLHFFLTTGERYRPAWSQSRWSHQCAAADPTESAAGGLQGRGPVQGGRPVGLVHRRAPQEARPGPGPEHRGEEVRDIYDQGSCLMHRMHFLLCSRIYSNAEWALRMKKRAFLWKSLQLALQVAFWDHKKNKHVKNSN